MKHVLLAVALMACAGAANAQDLSAAPRYVPGTANELDADTPAIQREFFDFYRTARGACTPAGDQEALTTQPLFSSLVKFLNFHPFNDIETISPRPMLFISGGLEQK